MPTIGGQDLGHFRLSTGQIARARVGREPEPESSLMFEHDSSTANRDKNTLSTVRKAGGDHIELSQSHRLVSRRRSMLQIFGQGETVAWIGSKPQFYKLSEGSGSLQDLVKKHLG